MESKKVFKVEIADEQIMDSYRIVPADDHFQAFEKTINQFPGDVIHGIIDLDEYFDIATRVGAA